MTWMHKVRLRVFALMLGTVLAAIATASLTTVPVWPVVGVAVAAVAWGISKMTIRLKQPVCWGCGGDLSQQAAGSDGVTTRVVEEREEAGGSPKEVSRNYFAIDRRTGDVYYFGEDVDVYKGGKVASHPGGWHSGLQGARFGLFIPSAPKAGDRF